MSFFDFILGLPFCRHSTAFQLVLEAVDESWPNRLFSARGFSPHLPVSTLRRSLSRQSLRQRFLLLGSVSLSGFRATHLPRKSSRYRSLSACPATQAVSHGFPGARFPQHTGPRQRASRLENLRRFRSHPDYHRPRSLPPRTVRRAVVRDRVCLGLHHHRFMPGAFSVGTIPPPQKRRETARAAGPARQHSSQCLCDRGPSSRRQPFGPIASRSRSVLLARSRVPGLWPPPPAHPRVRLLHHARQAEHTVLAAPVASGAPLDRIAVGSNHPTHRPKNLAPVSRPTAPHSLLRRPKGTALGFSHQQFPASGSDHRRTLPCPLARGVVFSLDQTAPAHQSILRHVRKRREDAGLGGRVGVCAGGDRQKTTGAGPESLQNTADSQRDRFRENPNFRRVFQLQRRVPGRRVLHAVESIRLLMGQY